MIKPPMLAGPKLTDLPLVVQSHILSFLCGTQSQPKIDVSLDGVSTVIAPLPNDLLSVAQASNILSTAVADALGPRATFLTSNVAEGKLTQWITVLTPFVKAVSAHSSEELKGVLMSVRAEALRESAAAIQPDPLHEARHIKIFSRALCSHTLHLFNILSADKVMLQVLDLSGVPFDSWNHREDDVVNGLVSALESSCDSLKELALPVSDLCAMALVRVTLRNLDVVKLEMQQLGRLNAAQLRLKELDGPLKPSVIEKGQPAAAFAQVLRALNRQAGRSKGWPKGWPFPAFVHMLRALDGHADRSQKTTTFRELQLVNIKQAPFASIPQSGCTPGFFNAVKTMRLDIDIDVNRERARLDNDGIAKFISLFPTLEFLYSNGAIRSKHLRLINRACTNMQAFHLSPGVRFKCWAQMGTAEDNHVCEMNSSELHKIFAACEGKLKTLVVRGKPTAMQMKVLGERNPDLEEVRMEIGADSVSGLELLLKSHCRRLRKLDLTVTPDHSDEGLGADGWQKFSEAICSASYELSEVTVRPNEDSVEKEGIKPLLRSMQEVIEFLGNRARKVIFHALTGRREEFPILVGWLCCILRTCSTHAKNLKVLEMDFYLKNHWTSRYRNQRDKEWEKELCNQYFSEKRKLLEEVPDLLLSLGSTELIIHGVLSPRG